MPYVYKIISGGQTGADQGGLEAGRILKIKTGGWIPLGWRTENGPRPALASYGLQETSDSGYPNRTHLNVKISDGTLIVGDTDSRGCSLTIRYCDKLEKPWYHLPFPFPDGKPTLLILQIFREWLDSNKIEVLNVAGNRESSNVGIFEFTKTFLVDALKDVIH